MTTMAQTDGKRPALRHLSASFNNADLNSSALRLICSLFPEWEQEKEQIKLQRCTDGITNTLLKATNRRPGKTNEEIDKDAILIRAYGKGSEVLIDREKEVSSHLLLASHGLAPELLARFQNGMIYRYIPGRVCTAADLREESIWKGVATKLGQWHATLPVLPSEMNSSNDHNNDHLEIRLPIAPIRTMPPPKIINSVTPTKVVPNMWTTMNKWIYALPARTDSQRARQQQLRTEMMRTIEELADLPGLGENGLVLSHCDLLAANIIIVPRGDEEPCTASDMEDVSFIDYEYAVPAPAAFDLANHFAEWGGINCDYTALPTRAERRAFLRQYLASYHAYKKDLTDIDIPEKELDDLCALVDKYRGIPGLYWGIWALIQAEISQIDFDYPEYAEIRLGEYFAWREEGDGSRQRAGKEMPLRERRLAE